MRIAVIGTGYVGLVSAACFAEMGHNVLGIDHDLTKIRILNQGGIPIYEEGLLEIVTKNIANKRLAFKTTVKEAVDFADIIFIAVNTPTNSTGDTDLTAIKKIARQIGEMLTSYKLIVVKSTVPVQTGKWFHKAILKNAPKFADFDIASNPEFLQPDRIVIGAQSQKAKDILLDVYKTFDCKKIVTDIESAEIIKHASNTFLAMKISFINSIANICERSGADINLVADGMGEDPRIGRAFLDAGIGWGGSCFPKDVKAFANIAQKLAYEFPLLEEIQRINRNQQDIVINKLRSALQDLHGEKIGLLGLAYKPKTDDMRNAPSIRIANLLEEEGAKIAAYDPKSMKNAEKILPFVKLESNPWDVVKNADAIVLVTEWQEFYEMDIAKIKEVMKGCVIVDGRNIWDRKKMENLGFTYFGIGR